VEWSDAKNLAWKADLPGRGPSSPIVVDGRVVVTCSSGPKQGRLHVIAFSAATGEQLWHRQFWATGRTYTHPSSAVAAPTPASDGMSIFAFFSSNDLICLDLDGNLLWYRGLAHDWPKAGNDVGMSSSPVVAGRTIVTQIENQGDSFACGIDTETGETRWRVKRDPRANWASPTILPGRGERKDVVLLQSPGGLTAHDLETGNEVWKYQEEFGTISSPLVMGNRAYLPTGGITAVEFSESSYSPEIKWQSGKLSTGSPSPIVHDGRIYTLSRGILSCGDIENGELLWKLRLNGRYWATPVIAGNIYCVNEEGEMRVIKPGDKSGEVIAENKFGETIQGTPAVVDGAIFVRSDSHLWKIAAK
jgi:outer membrane protein assembly factor BamB